MGTVYDAEHLMTYNFKFFQELGWAAFIAAAIQLLQVLVLFDPSKITDWRTWAVALAAGCVRAAAGAAIAVFGAKKVSGG